MGKKLLSCIFGEKGQEETKSLKKIHTQMGAEELAADDSWP